MFNVNLFAYITFCFLSEIVMWPRTLAKFHGLLLGVIIGFSLACVLVLWTSEGGYMKQTPIVSSNAGEWVLVHFYHDSILRVTLRWTSNPSGGGGIIKYV